MTTARDRRARRFAWTLTAVAAAGLAVRLAYVLVARRGFQPGGDAFFYHAGANLLADGAGFVSPFFYPARRVQAAEHPPLYLLFLALASLAGLRSVLAHLVWSCLLGTGTVVLVGLVGRAVGGPAVGLAGAAIAAVYPNLWAPDGMLQAETLAMFTMTLAVLLAYRAWRRPDASRVAALGAACGAAALTRSELALLVPLLVVPVALAAPPRTRRSHLGAAAVGVVAAGLVIAPWTVYNARRFVRPILLSAQIGPLLASANCDPTYYGAFQGYFDIDCAMEVARRAGLTDADDQAEQGAVYRDAAFAYVRAHLGRVPHVAGVRLARILGLYQPSLYANVDSFVEGRQLWVAWGGLWSFYVVAVSAVAGALVLRRRRDPDVPLFPLLAPLAAVVVTVVVTYGSTRFRAAAEPSLTVLAGAALVAVIAGVRRAGAVPRR